MNNKFHITTFGCQMNEHDSEIMAGLLLNEGYDQADERKNANIVIINTCSIRENADKRFFGTLGQLKKRKEKEKDFIVGVCGCMMQQEHIVTTIKTKYPWVDLVFGTHNFHQLPVLLNNLAEEKTKQVEIFEDSDTIAENLPAKRMFKHKALVNITYGCNNFCAYCIVPYTRGREKSRQPSDVIAEINHLVADGVKEITLLGQNVNSYKTVDGFGFTDLIYKINEIEGIERIRFMTSHPKDLSDSLINAFLECEKLSNYIHLPIQSGSDDVLKRMNRKYDSKKYLELVDKLKKTIPDIAISTDIIVGFPGETEQDFLDTLSLVKQVEFDFAFTFMYSIRKGTPAEKFTDQVPEDVKHERFNRLVEVINETSLKRNQKYLGKVVNVLVDGPSKKKTTMYAGRTEGFKLVNFRADESLVGQIVPVKITEAKTFTLNGEILQQ